MITQDIANKEAASVVSHDKADEQGVDQSIDWTVSDAELQSRLNYETGGSGNNAYC